MIYDVFISYSSKDKPIADAVCARLESAGIRCWFAPRDIVPGMSYGEAIMEAIHIAKVMVLVFSANANSSDHIPKEVERAVSNGLTIIPFRIEDVAPGRALDYFIGSVHWLDAMTPPLEKHLDNLAATIPKLLSVKSGERRIPPSDIVPAVVRPAAINAPARASASSSKAILIGVVAVVALALVVTGVLLVRDRGDVQSIVIVPGPSNGPGKTGAGRSSAMQPLKGNTDPIVGCYLWFNNEPVVIHADGTMAGGPFKGGWRLVSAARRAYTFTWPEATDTVTISPDQQSLSGANQYGYATSGTRIAGSGGLIGIWRWPNGVPVTVNPNGTFSAAAFNGRWRAVDASRGIYSLTWPDPVDSVTLSADGSRVSGTNQYTVAISGVRTVSCP